MIPLLIAAGLAGLGGLAYWLKTRRASSPLPVREFLTSADAPVLKRTSGIGNDYDALILTVAGAEGIDPVLLKAIVKKETNFDEEAVNPEQTFTIYGKTYAPSSLEGRRRLRDFIAGGGDPHSLGINPSLGLAQVRLSTGKHFISGLEPQELFDPQTNLTASARLLRELADAGITLETIDAYNVGQDLSPRNLPYRDAVKKNYELFRGDFS